MMPRDTRLSDSYNCDRCCFVPDQAYFLLKRTGKNIEQDFSTRNINSELEIIIVSTSLYAPKILDPSRTFPVVRCKTNQKEWRLTL